MGASMRLIGSAFIALVAAIVLVGVRDRAVDVPDGLILISALVVLARTALRGASDTGRRRYPRE